MVDTMGMVVTMPLVSAQWPKSLVDKTVFCSSLLFGVHSCSFTSDAGYAVKQSLNFLHYVAFQYVG